MKFARSLIKIFFFVLVIFCILIFSAVIYLNGNINNNFKIKKGESLNIASPLPVTAVYNGVKLSQVSGTKQIGEEFSVDIKAFGFIPVSKVSVEVVDELHVAVLGTPFGMKIYTKGVLITEISEVATENGSENPAQKAGLRQGDYIVSVDGVKVYTNEDLVSIVENSGGKRLKLEIMRDETKIYINITPVKSTDTNNYKIGIWVKDSSAGVGTLTFYSPSNNVLCGLGHGICDNDTGNLLKLNSGEVVTAEIISIEKGQVGSPGKLTGRLNYKTLGDINLNCEIGVYSLLKGSLQFEKLTEIALKQEVKDGQAQIICTIDNNQPKAYTCNIKVRNSNYHSKTQNMLLTVTDNALLEATGGIVQGMSGSPVVQNGKLVGAVTHVLVDDPTRGYAIFAENMLETAQSVADQQKLKEAS